MRRCKILVVSIANSAKFLASVKPMNEKMKEHTETKYDFPSIGCYVDESAGSANDCNRRTIEFAMGYGGFDPELDLDPDSEECSEDYSQNLSEAADTRMTVILASGYTFPIMATQRFTSARMARTPKFGQ